MYENYSDELRLFLYYLSKIYPCYTCRQHLQSFILNNEIPTTPCEFKKYLCMLHNSVNKKLNKPIFNCDDL